MKPRARRAGVARETLDILAQGSYITCGGRRVDIASALGRAVSGSIHYTPQMLDDVVTLRRQKRLQQVADPAFGIDVRNQRTLSAASSLVSEEPCSNVLCLNFASAKHPGGGFLRGSQAQEESLARASGLYACISPVGAMYEANRRCGSSLYADHMIYSPKVPVFRDDDDQLLATPYLVSFLTVPAVNAGAVRVNEKHNISRIESTMMARTEWLLSVTAVHDIDTLVLGAWGCGVFKNDPVDVARYFHTYLVRRDDFRGLFKRIVFAVWDTSSTRKFIRPFRETFG
jgi:uncharacterized protein (TIGR02452 family)